MDFLLTMFIVSLTLGLSFLIIKGISRTFCETPQSSGLSEEAKKIRADWKKAFKILYVSSIIVDSVLIALANPSIKQIEQMDAALITLGYSIVTTLFSGWLLSYLGFKKFGTKWLGFFVFIFPVVLVLQILGGFMTDPLMALVLFVYSIPGGYFWIHSLRLYQCNRSLKKQQKQSTVSAAAVPGTIQGA